MVVGRSSTGGGVTALAKYDWGGGGGGGGGEGLAFGQC